MRVFNTSGPCDPEKHYTVMREGLVAQGEVLVEQGRYFTIFAPRQSGKTTYLQLLLRQLQKHGYLPIWISFEGLKTLTRPRFYQALTERLQQEFALYDIKGLDKIEDQFGLELYLKQASSQPRPIVIFIDEFEDIPTEVLNELMHIFRSLYHKRQFHKLHSLGLVGVSTVAELVLSSASPFNVVDELRIPYFTLHEVQDLIGQYVRETGQSFDADVVHAIYENSVGQPGLVCALCQYLVTVVVTNRNEPVTIEAFYRTLNHFLTERFDKNISNIVQKAREKREFMLRVLFGDSAIPFSVNEPNIAWLFANGVIGNVNGYVDVIVPLYSKALITAFRPLINGEAQHYVSAYDTFADYVNENGLNLGAIIEKYREYIHRRGFQAFDTEHLKEGAWHYSLDNFINFFVERLGGMTFVEVPSGRGRADILIVQQGRKYLIETKVFSDQYLFQQGKQQLADYLTSEGLSEGYYVVFSNKHSKDDQLTFEEMINGKQIHTTIILTKFEQPSRRKFKPKRQ